MHIDIAATDVLAIPDQKYFGKQVSSLGWDLDSSTSYHRILKNLKLLLKVHVYN